MVPVSGEGPRITTPIEPLEVLVFHDSAVSLLPLLLLKCYYYKYFKNMSK